MNRDNDQYWENIDDFLDRRQSTEERKAFEQRITQESDLQSDIKLQQDLRRGIAYGSSGELKNRLRQIHQDMQTPSAQVVTMRTNRKGWQNWLAVAAVLAVATLGVVLWTQQSTVDEQSLFALNYSPYALDLTQRGEALPADLAKLEDSYGNGQFVEAAPLLDQALQNDPNNASLALAQAITYWETGHTADAQQQLEDLFRHPLLKDQAYWYAGLFALQQTDTENAKIYFQKISPDSGRLYEQAQNLLERLK